VVPALRPIYDYAWFAGFGVAFLLHVALMQTRLRPALRPSFPEG
jgi:cytosine/uracil/thiamine/allantoin permease